MSKEFMETFESFKIFMRGEAVPNYVSSYCASLDELRMLWFYSQMAIAVNLTDELEYLFYVLKWILKSDFSDIAYEMYCCDMMDAECRPEPLVKPSFGEALSERYHKAFAQDYGLPL
jgi:hypothetical protein